MQSSLTAHNKITRKLLSWQAKAAIQAILSGFLYRKHKFDYSNSVITCGAWSKKFIVLNGVNPVTERLDALGELSNRLHVAVKTLLW